MGKELTTPEKVDTIFAPIQQMINESLPEGITPETFKNALIVAGQNDPGIFKNSPDSIRNALIKCASDGLVPDGREAAIVPFDGKATYTPMVQGIIKRLREIGEVYTVNAQCIYEKDFFECDESNLEKTKHIRPQGFAERGEVVGAYAIFKDESGRVIGREIMTVDDLDKVASVSKAKNGPWKHWRTEMYRKTVIRRGSKYIPMSSSAYELVSRDDQFYDLDISPNEGPGLQEVLDEEKSARANGFDQEHTKSQIQEAQQTASEPPELPSEPVEDDTPQKPEQGSPEHTLEAYKAMVDNCQLVEDLRHVYEDKALTEEMDNLPPELKAEARQYASNKRAELEGKK